MSSFLQTSSSAFGWLHNIPFLFYIRMILLKKSFAFIHNFLNSWGNQLFIKHTKNVVMQRKHDLDNANLVLGPPHQIDHVWNLSLV